MTRNAMNIQVPVLVGYKYDVMDILALRAQVGPTANFVIPGKTLVQKSAAMEGAELPAALEDAEFDTKSIAWGVQMGIGADILGFTLDINYNLGVSKIFGAKLLNNLDSEWINAVDLNNMDQTKQNLFMVTVGYKLL